MKLHSIITGIPLLSTFLFLGCTDQKAHDDIQALQKATLDFASNQDSANKGFVSGHNEQTTAIKDLQERVEALQVQTSIFSTAEGQPNIDIHGRGYSVVKTSSGFYFYALVEHVETRLDGVAVKLKLGNPYNIGVNDFKVTLRWGKEFPAFLTNMKDVKAFCDSYNSFTKSLKATAQDFTIPLMPGSWTSVEVIISPATIADIKYCSISVDLGKTILIPPKQ